MSVEVRVPQVTQTMSECTITRWLKKEGEAVEAGEPLFEMETDKAAVEVESPGSGTLCTIRVASGVAPVGGVVAFILAAGERPPEGAAPAPAPQVAAGPKQPSPSLASGTKAAGRVRVSPPARRLASEHGIDLRTVVPTGPDGLITEADVRRCLEDGGAAPALAAGEVALGPCAQAPTRSSGATRRRRDIRRE